MREDAVVRAALEDLEVVIRRVLGVGPNPAALFVAGTAGSTAGALRWALGEAGGTAASFEQLLAEIRGGNARHAGGTGVAPRGEG